MIYENNVFNLLTVNEIKGKNDQISMDESTTDLIFVWNKGIRVNIEVNKTQNLLLDKNEILILTKHHHIKTLDFESLRLIRFNLSFFNHTTDELMEDLKTILFNLENTSVLSFNEDELQYFESLWDIFCLEMIPANETDILRRFRFLVDTYFSKHHDIAFYASMLSRSPKTLSNIFSLVSNRTPTQIIHERIMAEARKQIYYTTMSIKEIAYGLGYEDVQTFSRFFKNKEGISPVRYREKNTQVVN
jgi:AraC-like DNA-binding protein